jgi:hypothetical protein
MEGHFDLILSIDQLNKTCRDVTQLRFAVQPEAVNSHHLHADVTSALYSCSTD